MLADILSWVGAHLPVGLLAPIALGAFNFGKNWLHDRHFSKRYGYFRQFKYVYWLAPDPDGSSQPVWMCGKQELQAKGRRIRGKGTSENHPLGTLQWDFTGEIQQGLRLISRDTFAPGEPRYACSFYPDIRPKDVLVGIWMGHDPAPNAPALAAPVVLSVAAQTPQQLATRLSAAKITLFPVGLYDLYSSVADKTASQDLVRA